MIEGKLAVGVLFLIFIMMESILLENVFEKRQPNCNGEILVIYGSHSGFGRDNNLLASLIYIYIYIIHYINLLLTYVL